MDHLPENRVLAGRARNAIYGCWAVIVFTAGLLLIELATVLGMLDPLAASPTVASAYVFVAGGYTVAFIASVILVAMWIHRAHANLHHVGIEGLEFTPGWAVGWYFIPFANLIKPFQAMRELWNASMGQSDSFSEPAPGEVKYWWGTWIGGNILSNVAGRMTDADGGTNQFGSVLALLSSIAILICAWLLIGLVTRITEAQAGRVHVAEVFD